MKKRKNILCVSYGGGHAAMLAPVVKELQKNKEFNVYAMGLTTGGKYLREKGIHSFGFNEYSFLVGRQYKKVGQQLFEPKSQSQLVPVKESIAYLGINMLEMIDLYGEKEAFDRYAKLGRQEFLPVNFFSKLLSHLNIDLLITTNSPRSEQASILAARKLGIKSICLVDLFALQEYKWIRSNTYADKVCVLNQEVKEFLVSKGRRGQDIIVTGNPAFDEINADRNIEEANSGKYEFSKMVMPDSVNILYASQPEPVVHPFCNLSGDPTLPRTIETWLREIVLDNERYNLIIRPHPSENYDFSPAPRVFNGVGDLHVLIHSVDILVTMTSTVGLEAYIAGKRVITVDLSIFTNDAPYSKMGISKGVRTKKMLKKQINEYVNESTSNTLKFQSDSAVDKIMVEVEFLLN